MGGVGLDRQRIRGDVGKQAGIEIGAIDQVGRLGIGEDEGFARAILFRRRRVGPGREGLAGDGLRPLELGGDIESPVVLGQRRLATVGLEERSADSARGAKIWAV